MVLNDHARIHNKRLHGDHVWNPDGVLNFYSGISFARNADSVPFWMFSFIERGLVVLRCVFWMLATGVMESIKRGDVEKVGGIPKFRWTNDAPVLYLFL